MNVNGFDTFYQPNFAHTTIFPETLGSAFFKLESFGFGKFDSGSGKEYYEDLLNSDPETYG
jgi:SNF family Na+-dependent transporter